MTANDGNTRRSVAETAEEEALRFELRSQILMITKPVWLACDLTCWKKPSVSR